MASLTTYRIYRKNIKQYISGYASKSSWQKGADVLTAARKYGHLGEIEIHKFNMFEGNEIFSINGFQVHLILTNESTRIRIKKEYESFRKNIENNIRGIFKKYTGITLNNIDELPIFIEKNSNIDYVKELERTIIKSYDNYKLSFEEYVNKNYKI